MFHRTKWVFFSSFVLLGFIPSTLWKKEVRYSLQYRVEVSRLPPKIKNFRLWAPYPLEGPYQKILSANISSPLPWRMEKDKKYGNTIFFAEGTPPRGHLTFLIDVEILRRRDVGFKGAENSRLFLDQNITVPLNPLIQKIAQSQAGSFADPFKKIRALYEYVYQTINYSKEGVGWGKGDPIWACTNKRGNCTDFHSLFIALANAQGIPARFEIGLPIPSKIKEGSISGYHCWAQALDSKQGWIPLDISESKKRGDVNAFFYQLPPDRILLSVGRNIVLNPPAQGKPLNFFSDPYAEADGRKIETLQARYYFKVVGG